MTALKAFLLTLTLLVFTPAAYDAHISHQLAGMSLIAYEQVSSIQSWSCGPCKSYKLTSVKAVSGDIQWFAGYSETLKGIVLSFRGSSNIPNWITNLSVGKATYSKCSGCQVHSGFLAAWNNIKAAVHSAIQSLRSTHRDVPIFITGHSLGGAMATLAAPDIKESFGIHSLYTYGEPRVGNPEFSKWFRSVVYSFRVIHSADIVPHIPWASTGFLHEGEELWYDAAMSSYKTCGYGESSSCSNSLGALYNTGDHSMSTYVKLPATFLDQVSNAFSYYFQFDSEKESEQLAVEIINGEKNNLAVENQ
jgi:hypothetical protein